MHIKIPHKKALFALFTTLFLGAVVSVFASNADLWKATITDTTATPVAVSNIILKSADNACPFNLGVGGTCTLNLTKALADGTTAPFSAYDAVTFSTTPDNLGVFAGNTFTLGNIADKSGNITFTAKYQTLTSNTVSRMYGAVLDHLSMETTCPEKVFVGENCSFVTYAHYQNIAEKFEIPATELIFSFDGNTIGTFVKNVMTVTARGTAKIKAEYKGKSITSTTSFVAEKHLGVYINSIAKDWNFPISIAGQSELTKTYGLENTLPIGTETDNSAIPNAASENIVVLHLSGTGPYIWTPYDTSIGSLYDKVDGVTFKNATEGYLCTKDFPCLGDTVFVSKNEIGTAAISVQDSTLKETASYTFEVLPSSTKKIEIFNPTGSVFYSQNKIQLYAKRYLESGEVISQEEQKMTWEYSTDGGKTFVSDGIAAGNFIPTKEGTYIFRAKYKEQKASAGSGKLNFETVEYVSDPSPAITFNPFLVDITFLDSIGNRGIGKDTTETLKLRLSTQGTLAGVENMEVMMLKGTIAESTDKKKFLSFPPSIQKFILREANTEDPVKKKLADSAGLKTALFDVPVYIPAYSDRDMPAGPYTFVVNLYQKGNIVAQKMLYTFIGAGQMCDVNGDGNLNLIDIILAMKFVNESVKPDGGQLARADMNTNGVTDLSDIIELFRCMNKKETAQNSCSFNGQTIAHNTTAIFSTEQWVPYGQTCPSITATCQNGEISLSGPVNGPLFPFESCKVVGANDCAITRGNTTIIIPHGQSKNMYSTKMGYNPKKTCDGDYMKTLYCQNKVFYEDAAFTRKINSVPTFLDAYPYESCQEARMCHLDVDLDCVLYP
ncbi:MAG: dockerin type I repeat-containing protein [Candidatus Peregrinibacteria bacterium]